jgi:hypothetical protein
MNSAVRRFLRQIWLRELLVVALLLKALIPAGYMPDVGADGVPTLKLCASVVTLAGGSAGPPTDTGEDSADLRDHSLHGVCPQGVLNLPAVAPSLLLAHSPTLVPAAVVRDAAAGARYSSPTPHSRLPRGPPATV